MSMVLVYLKQNKKDRITLLHPAAIKSRKKGSVLVVTILELSLQKKTAPANFLRTFRVAFHLSMFFFYSSNKIRRHKMSTWTSFVKIWTVSNCEFNATFLTSLGLYHLLFALETIEVSLNLHLMANIWEKTISTLAGNLNLGHNYLITTVLQV